MILPFVDGSCIYFDILYWLKRQCVPTHMEEDNTWDGVTTEKYMGSKKETKSSMLAASQ